MTYTAVNSYFPSQVVSDAEKLSYDYGLKVAKAIEFEWFSNDTNHTRYDSNYRNFHELRLYARGEQSIKKYKDELSINGDLSYLNLDWKPVPIISKFVDIVVNGIAERTYNVKAYSQDPYGVSKRTAYMESIIEDMRMKSFDEFTKESFGINLAQNEPDTLPGNEEELALHMQLSYKQSVELAEEQALNVLMDGNNYELIRKRFYQDLTVLGIGAVKTNFTTSEGVTIDYVDPAKLVYSYTESPYFDDLYYVGEIKTIPINELAKQFPHLEQSDLEEIKQSSSLYNKDHYQHSYSYKENDKNKVQVLYFNYKTYMNEVYKVKETSSGAEKAIEKDDQFNPPENMEGGFTRLDRVIEVLYEGAIVVGTNKLLSWGMAKNMMRPKSDYTKVKMNYSIVAPRMYKGKIESLVGRMTSFADMIQLTHLKLQQVLSRMVPDGVYLDADGIAEIDLGNGTNYNPQEALNMYFQTGSVIGRSMTQDGDYNHSRTPVQELQSGHGGQKISSLINSYNYYLQMIRDVTGLNEARDGSMPDKDSLVGLQKMAANASNTATKHILNAMMYLTVRTCENISLKVADSLKNPLTLNSLKSSISTYNVATLAEIQNLPLHDFGIYLELEPEEEEKAMLEQNIQMSLQQGGIDLEDAIDIRRIKNLKLANDVLKQKRKQKQKQAQEQQMQMMQAQEQAKAETAQAVAQAELQKQQALTASNVQYEQAKAQMEMQKLQTQAQIKREEMEIQHMYDMELKRMEVEAMKSKEEAIEDRKDKRTKMEGTQQSKMIEQRKMNLMPTDFEKEGM